MESPNLNPLFCPSLISSLSVTTPNRNGVSEDLRRNNGGWPIIHYFLHNNISFVLILHHIYLVRKQRLSFLLEARQAKKRRKIEAKKILDTPSPVKIIKSDPRDGNLFTVKKVSGFPVPSRDVTN